MATGTATARPVVAEWSGWEAKALRHARRMSTREFGEHLGISDRMVAKWEAGGRRLRPRQQNQAALDTSLAMADVVAQQRFALILAKAGGARPIGPTTAVPSLPAVPPQVTHLVRHPVDRTLMTLVESGPFAVTVGRPAVWLSAFYIDVSPITCTAYSGFLDATDHRRPATWSKRPQGCLDYEPDAGNEPIAGIGWDDALAYSAWAGKELPTVEQWLRAVNGPEGTTAARLREWCHDRGRPGQSGPKRAPGGGFRCVTALGDMLALLAI